MCLKTKTFQKVTDELQPRSALWGLVHKKLIVACAKIPQKLRETGTENFLMKNFIREGISLKTLIVSIVRPRVHCSVRESSSVMCDIESQTAAAELPKICVEID